MICSSLKRLSLCTSILFAASIGLWDAPAFAQATEASQTVASTGYVLPETEVFDMTAAHGLDYRIYVSRPEGEAPEGGYPVLYVLDGNAMFAGFAEARRIKSIYDTRLDKMIVVGIGFPNTELYDPRRMYDFTPPIETPALKELYKEYKAGGRDKFLTFLLDEVRPEIASRYSVSEQRQSLFGHSLGGLFALHVLYSKPGAFYSIIAASPTIWWDNQMILKEERAFTKRLKKSSANNNSVGNASRVLVLVGEREETSVTVGDSVALGKRLEALSLYGLRSDYEVQKNETHVTVPSRSITTTLRAAMQWP